jgi:hypothetical protein
MAELIYHSDGALGKVVCAESCDVAQVALFQNILEGTAYVRPCFHQISSTAKLNACFPSN